MSEAEKKNFNKFTEFPDHLSETQNGFSVDVLIYVKHLNLHTIGWFDFNVMSWRFLSNENYTNFYWRYFTNEEDRVLKPEQFNCGETDGRNGRCLVPCDYC